MFFLRPIVLFEMYLWRAVHWEGMLYGDAEAVSRSRSCTVFWSFDTLPRRHGVLFVGPATASRRLWGKRCFFLALVAKMILFGEVGSGQRIVDDSATIYTCYCYCTLAAASMAIHRAPLRSRSIGHVAWSEPNPFGLRVMSPQHGDLFGRWCCCVGFASFHCYWRCLANVQSRSVFFHFVHTIGATKAGVYSRMIAQINLCIVHG